MVGEYISITKSKAIRIWPTRYTKAAANAVPHESLSEMETFETEDSANTICRILLILVCSWVVILTESGLL